MALAVWCDEHGESHGVDTPFCPECGAPDWKVEEPEHIDGYWDDEFERQWHYEVKGG